MTELTSLEILRSIYPDRVALNPSEVAAVLFGKQDRATVQGVREMLKEGHLAPHLGKLGGRWIIPITALAQSLDDLQFVVMRRPPIPHQNAQARKKRSGWRAPIGPRVGDPI
jgi:hypothetical protein